LGCVVDWLLVSADVVLSWLAGLLLVSVEVVLLWAAELLLVDSAALSFELDAVLLFWAVVLLLSATWATAGALVAAVEVSAVADCCEPNATQAPSVPTTAAVAIADFIFADNRCRRDVSLLAMILLLPAGRYRSRLWPSLPTGCSSGA
jgi:hypothetical protein